MNLATGLILMWKTICTILIYLAIFTPVCVCTLSLSETCKDSRIRLSHCCGFVTKDVVHLLLINNFSVFRTKKAAELRLKDIHSAKWGTNTKMYISQTILSTLLVGEALLWHLNALYKGWVTLGRRNQESSSDNKRLGADCASTMGFISICMETI